jgi:uncharacterized protein DUF2635
MLVKPAPGIRLKDPRSMRVIPPEGIEVPDNDIWFTQRIAQGDLVNESARLAKDAADKGKQAADAEKAAAAAEHEAEAATPAHEEHGA